MTTHCFYRMTHDTGFAPNPYYGYCTLAACTPNHKRCRLGEGDILVGIESNTLINKRNSIQNTSDKGRRIVYWMEIKETLTLNKYFHGQRYRKKRPVPNGSQRQQAGDNAYYMEGNKWKWVSGHAHDDSASGCALINQDTHGDRVFVSSNFYYFGDQSISFPREFEDMVPKYQGVKYAENDKSIGASLIEKFDNYVHNYVKKTGNKGRLGDPLEIQTGTCKSCHTVPQPKGCRRE